MIVACLSRRRIALCAIFVFAAATCRAQTSPAPREQQVKPSDELLAEGVAALERGDAPAARDLLERALAADPHSAEAHTYLGVLPDRAGDLNDAERHYALAARLAPQAARTRDNYDLRLDSLHGLGEAAAE